MLEIYGIDRKALDGGIISSVVPPLTNVMRRAAAKVTGREILVVGPGVKTGLDIRIDNPAQLGTGLVVGAVAGVEEYSCPLVIIDTVSYTHLGIQGLSKKVRDYGKLAEKLGVGEPTLRDIVKELEKPGRDPRDEMPRPILRTDVLEMKDLTCLLYTSRCV